MALDPNFPKLVLDPGKESELVQLAYNRIKVASGNTITDFRAGSAVAALVEGQTFALAELLYYLNLMPEAIAIEVFRLYGITRSLGTFASGALTFSLAEPAVDVFSLPAGYPVPYLSGNLILQNALTIQVGSQEGTAPVVSDTVGKVYNANAFDVLATNNGLARVQSIYNRLPLTGGSDLEPLEALVKRCQASTVSRSSVITKTDYELAAQSFLGIGSRALAVANLAPDLISYLQASVVLFTLDAAGQPTSPTTNGLLKENLSTKILMGTSVTCLPAVLQPLTVEVNANVRGVDTALGSKIASAVVNYLNPAKWVGVNRLVRNDEIAFFVRSLDKVLSVDNVKIEGLDADYTLANLWTLPFASVVYVNMTDLMGQLVLFTGGVGSGTPYDPDEDLL